MISQPRYIKKQTRKHPSKCKALFLDKIITVPISIIVFVLILWSLRYSFTNAVVRKAFFGTEGSSKESGWQDSNVSAASQGKLWRPMKYRSFPRSQSLFPLKNISKMSVSKLGPSCSHWAVVTTIFAPSKLLHQLRAIPGWCLVVVGDKKTYDPTWRSFVAVAFNSTVYLSARDQEMLPYRLKAVLPWNHFGRKNIGYIYAIHHGAEVIWDTDDDNVLKQTSLLDSMAFTIRKSQRFSTINVSPHIWNPYPHYKAIVHSSGNIQKNVWPRGLPLLFVKDVSAITAFESNFTSSVNVIQSLADNDPDVDAIYRLSQPFPMSFFENRGEIKTIALPHGRYAPFNAQATMWKRPAFWGLLLPISVHGRVSDIWRSYIVQRLMHEVNMNLAFSTPIVDQFRNVHAYIADLQAEIPLYTQAHELVKWLLEWSNSNDSLSSFGFVAAIENLYIDLFEIGIIEIEDVYTLQAWLSDLISIGYNFPEISNRRTFNDIQEPEQMPVAVNIAVCGHTPNDTSAHTANKGLRSIELHINKLESQKKVDYFVMPRSKIKVCNQTLSCTEVPSTTTDDSLYWKEKFLEECENFLRKQEINHGIVYDWTMIADLSSELKSLPSTSQVTLESSKPTLWYGTNDNNCSVMKDTIFFAKRAVMREYFYAALSEISEKSSRNGSIVEAVLKSKNIAYQEHSEMRTCSYKE